MTLASQASGGRRLSAHALLDLGLWRVAGNGHVKSDKEFRGVLLC